MLTCVKQSCVHCMIGSAVNYVDEDQYIFATKKKDAYSYVIYYLNGLSLIGLSIRFDS